MPTNIEIKASVRDLDALQARVAAMSVSPGEEIVQEDTFFTTPTGRLKLRALGPDCGELIFYQRADSADPKPSHYRLATVKNPTALGAVLAAALGVRGVVRKRRRLYLIGRTRVHLDQVEGLGGFIELEVVLGEGEAVSQGEAVAVELMDRLGIARSDLVRGAYLDLLFQPPEGSPGRDGSHTTEA
jgi:predicted adenylyl cyclase CyaB